MSVIINKATKTNVKFKIFDDYTSLNPINLLDIYVEFVCAITDQGRLLLEKRFSTNDIDIITDMTSYLPYIVNVKFTKEDTINLNINPSDEERIRILELFAIDINRQPTLLIKTNFYLEGTGYYVR